MPKVPFGRRNQIMHNKQEVAELRRVAAQLYGGMFSGIVFLACTAGCFGLAGSLSEWLLLVTASVASTTILFGVSQSV